MSCRRRLRDFSILVFLIAVLAGAASSTFAAPKAEEGEAPSAPSPSGKGFAMDYGPFLSSSLDRDPAVSRKQGNGSTEQAPTPNNLVTKSVNVRLASGRAAVAFDTDLCRYAAGWGGGFVNLKDTHLTSEKGSIPVTLPAGAKLVFTNPKMPGVVFDHAFKDPRPHPYGPLPKDVAHYRGLYRNGERVVFSYTIGDVPVLDLPGAVEKDGTVTFTRTLHVGPSTRAMSFMVGELPNGGGASAAGLPEGASLWSDAGRAVIDLPAHAQAVSFKVAVGGAVGASGPVEDLPALTKGGPALWTKLIRTPGHPAAAESKKAYAVDALGLPDDNPWQSWIRPTGLDFFSDGRLAFCTWSGDVWIGSGIDDSLKNVTWRRFAAGLYEPLGLKIVNDQLFVCGRDQITRLRDLNNDGEADFYENFNNDAVAIANYHGFAMDLDADPAGNLYYVRVGHRADSSLPNHGALLRVSADGQKLDVIAGGLRAANGLSVGPQGQITVADNQGNWTPTSRLNLVRPGGFYGYVPHATVGGLFPPRTDYDPPLCWIPYGMDNSSGGQVWATGERWGPLNGQLLHTSYGKASLFLVLQDAGPAGHLANPKNGTPQGGTVRLPLTFDSGIMRGRMNPKDGQLYVCGLKGWQTAGTRDGAVARVRYTGKPLNLPVGLKILSGALELTFSDPLDKDTANDPQSYGVEQWNYRWTKEYGSPEFSVKNPDQQGHDEVEVKKATLAADGRTVRLDIPTPRPVMQLRVRLNLDAADGATIDTAVDLTINRVPGGADASPNR